MAAGHSQGHTQAAILKAWLYIDQGFIKARSSSRSGISLSKECTKRAWTRRAVVTWAAGQSGLERGAARSWERQRTTGTALAVGLAVLGTLLVIRGHRWDTDVAAGKADRPAPDAADAAAGRSAHTVSPVGAKEVATPIKKPVVTPIKKPDEHSSEISCGRRQRRSHLLNQGRSHLQVQAGATGSAAGATNQRATEVQPEPQQCSRSQAIAHRHCQT